MTRVLFDIDAAFVLLAGFLAGATGGLAAAGVMLVALLRSPKLRARIPGGMHPVAVAILAVNGFVFAWTLVGLVLGALYLNADMPGFTLGVVIGTLALLAGAAFVRRRLTWPMWSTAGIAILAFGGMLPGLVALR